MEEIKVGEYVRTKLGNIAKIVAVKDTVVYTDDFIDVHCRYNEGIIEKTDIVKHSPNIIDLIEEGDYVNGVEVVDLADGIHLKFANDVSFVEVGLCTYMDGHVEGIETIVTHEQFNQVKYEV